MIYLNNRTINFILWFLCYLFIKLIILHIFELWKTHEILYFRGELAKKYGFTATSTMFTAKASQLQAKRAGFEEGCSMDYADVVDEEGNPQFPNIKSKCVKIMMKRLPWSEDYFYCITSLHILESSVKKRRSYFCFFD